MRILRGKLLNQGRTRGLEISRGLNYAKARSLYSAVRMPVVLRALAIRDLLSIPTVQRARKRLTKSANGSLAVGGSLSRSQATPLATYAKLT